MQSVRDHTSNYPKFSDAASTGCLLVVIAVIIASAVWFTITFWPIGVVDPPPEEETQEEPVLFDDPVDDPRTEFNRQVS